MKAGVSLFAIPLMIGAAFAQSSGSQPPSQPSSQSGSQSSQTAQPAAQAPTASTPAGAPAQMKTMTYKGTLVDMSCGSSTASAAAPASGEQAASNTANRSAGEAGSCPVSANTTQFGLKTEKGETYRFDLVGNQRAQDEFKNNKHWSSAASANKPLKVKISGVVQGDKLIVSSIH